MIGFYDLRAMKSTYSRASRRYGAQTVTLGYGYLNMHVEFRKAIIPDEMVELLSFDHKMFPRIDLFEPEDWEEYESYWMIIDSAKVGCCAFQHNVDFQEDVREDETNPPMQGSLYIATTGILSEFRRRGLGDLFKCWQIAYAKTYSFDRIVTNMRKSNAPSFHLNLKFGFQQVRESPGYYPDGETTVVLDLTFPESNR